MYVNHFDASGLVAINGESNTAGHEVVAEFAAESRYLRAGCKEGQHLNPKSKKCEKNVKAPTTGFQQCPAGQYSTPGSTSCQRCPGGTKVNFSQTGCHGPPHK